MYNGIGLQTPRGSGTNGYIQTNKFFVRPRTDKVAHAASRGFDEDQGMTRKPNKEILEHDRKRQIHLKLVVLEDKLIEQGYTDAEIAEKMEEARKKLEAEAVALEESGRPTTALISGNANLALAKERQMETLRAALGIQSTDPSKEVADLRDDVPSTGMKSAPNDGSKWVNKSEHAFLDRDFDFDRKKDATEDLDIEKDNKKTSAAATKNRKKGEEDDEPRHDRRAEGKRKKHHRRGSDSDTSSSAEEGEVIRNKHRRGRNESSDEADSDSDYGKKRASKKVDMKAVIRNKHRRGRDESSDEADSDSDYGKKRASKKHHRSNRSRH